MGFLGRTALGALAGGGYKAWQGDNMSGIYKGAAAGALAGGIGGHYAAKLGRKVVGAGKKMTPANILTAGLGGMSKAGHGMFKFGAKRHNTQKFGGQAFASAGSFMTNNAMAAKKYIGKNAAAVNKYGGYVMGAIGAAAALKIGHSVLKSNNPQQRQRR